LQPKNENKIKNETKKTKLNKATNINQKIKTKQQNFWMNFFIKKNYVIFLRWHLVFQAPNLHMVGGGGEYITWTNK